MKFRSKDFNLLEDFYKAFSWAEKNNVRVYPVKRGSKFVLFCEDNGKLKTSGKEYERKEIDIKQKEFYIYLWKKYNNGRN